jgi:hypothetical protein
MARKNGISQFLYKAPTDQTYSAGIQDVEKEVVEEVIDIDMAEEVPAECDVCDLVFTADKPVFLMMSDKNGIQNNLIRKASELGIYKKKMKRNEIAKALEKYWVERCGSYEKYVEAPIFHQEDQEICRKRKSSTSKRKNNFADAQTDTKKKSGRIRKSPMSPQVKASWLVMCECCYFY